MPNIRARLSTKLGAISLGISTGAQIGTIGYNSERLGEGKRHSIILRLIDGYL